MSKILLFNKPYKTLCQFTDSQGRDCLANYIKEKSYYAAGRLDYDSEGLVLLTSNGALQHQISHPDNKMAKCYWVQVEGEIDEQAIDSLSSGIVLKDGPTLPAKVKKITEPVIWPRTPPVRIRRHIPTCWVSITLREGKNRQVRRMTAAVGFPTLRLIRYSIGPYSMEDLKPGEYRFKEVNLPVKKTKPGLRKSRKK